MSTKPVDTRGKTLRWRKVICKVQFYIQTSYQVQQKNKDTFKSPKHLSAMNPFLVIYWRMCSNKTKDIPRKMTGAPGNSGSNRKRRKEDPQNDAEGKLWDVSTTSWGGTSSNQLRVWSRKTNPGRQPTGRKQQLRDYDVFITLRRTWGWITQKHPPKYTVKHTRQLLTPRWGEDVLESKYTHSTLCIQTGFPGGSVVKKNLPVSAGGAS